MGRLIKIIVTLLWLLPLWLFPMATIANATLLDNAAQISVVQDLMRIGQYQQAYEMAIALETAEGYALASESLARQVLLGEAQNLKKAAKTARDLAEEALRLKPNHQNARLQYALADGFVVRMSSGLSAWMKKLPQKSFEKIEIYRQFFPEDERGDALLGAWHLGIARKIGDERANNLFGASIGEGMRLYEQALQKSPNDPVMLINYAFSLLTLQADDYHDLNKVRGLIEHAQAQPPQDDLERKLIEHGLNVLTLLTTPEKARNYADQFLEGEAIESDIYE